MEVARDLLDQYKSLTGLSRCSVKELRKIKGIGPAKAIELVAAFNHGKRLAREKLSQQKLDSPGLIYELLGREMRMLRAAGPSKPPSSIAGKRCCKGCRMPERGTTGTVSCQRDLITAARGR